MTDAWVHRVKAAQRDLIKLAGGIERAVEITSMSKSQVGRWNNAGDPDLMPLPVVLALEADTGKALVTAVMAETNGRRLADIEDGASVQVNVMRANADVARAVAELQGQMALILEDFKVTPTEAQTADRMLFDVSETVSRMRASLAGIKAAGGLKLVGEA